MWLPRPYTSLTFIFKFRGCSSKNTHNFEIRIFGDGKCSQGNDFEIFLCTVAFILFIHAYNLPFISPNFSHNEHIVYLLIFEFDVLSICMHHTPSQSCSMWRSPLPDFFQSYVYLWSTYLIASLRSAWINRRCDLKKSKPTQILFFWRISERIRWKFKIYNSDVWSFREISRTWEIKRIDFKLRILYNKTK
jgi:hypothetical protein